MKKCYDTPRIKNEIVPLRVLRFSAGKDFRNREGSIDPKGILRKKMINLLMNQKEEERSRKSQVILQRLFRVPEFLRARIILSYAAIKGEVDTFPMMRQAQSLGKKFGLTTILEDQKMLVPYLVENLEEELELGPYGITQPRSHNQSPLALEDIDLVIVPGTAFDKDNYRLGRGHGYYDRFLKRLPSQTPAIGLAFDFQMVNRLPHREEHDIPVSFVISN